jgi:hypothetical protein
MTHPDLLTELIHQRQKELREQAVGRVRHEVRDDRSWWRRTLFGGRSPRQPTGTLVACAPAAAE